MGTDAARYGTRRQQILLGILVLGLIVALAFAWNGGRGGSAPAEGQRPTSNKEASGRASAGTSASAGDLDVKLEALDAPHEGPGAIERNPFRFEARRRAEPEPAPSEPPPTPEPEEPAVPTGPPQPPPIPLKFIGIIESPQAGRVAALSDGRRVFQGRAGDIIEGRYRIVRIGVESIVMEYADGSGTQQTIRLSGQ